MRSGGGFMAEVVFITGNQKKADYLAKYLGYPVSHRKVELDELQSLDLKTIVEHKARQAYEIVKKPVIVEDVSLEFAALGGLPGPFIRFFVDKVDDRVICDMIHGRSRSATARCVFGYYDGKQLQLFEGSMPGTIAESPAGGGGYGWDTFFIPQGYSLTRAELSEEDDQKTYVQIKPFAQLKAFLDSR
jgi:non-canonical purine NTP pyrophosphatase (RdgB/HAM1 family)